jgi:hypothetical protein
MVAPDFWMPLKMYEIAVNANALVRQPQEVGTVVLEVVSWGTNLETGQTWRTDRTFPNLKEIISKYASGGPGIRSCVAVLNADR